MHLPNRPITYANATYGLSSKPAPPPQDPVTTPHPPAYNLLISFSSVFKTLLNPLISLLTKVITSPLETKMINSVTINSLLILLSYANGFKNHINKFQSVLYNIRIDIAFITETHFNKYSKFHIPGFHPIKTNHPDNTAHSGVALLYSGPRKK